MPEVVLTVCFCDTFPERLEFGKLYVSKAYETTIHLCPCGCSKESVVPIYKGRWRMTEKDGLITIKPSILNTWCGSHYWLNDNKIIWQP